MAFKYAPLALVLGYAAPHALTPSSHSATNVPEAGCKLPKSGFSLNVVPVEMEDGRLEFNVEFATAPEGVTAGTYVVGVVNDLGQTVYGPHEAPPQTVSHEGFAEGFRTPAGLHDGFYQVNISSVVSVTNSPEPTETMGASESVHLEIDQGLAILISSEEWLLRSRYMNTTEAELAQSAEGASGVE